MTIARTARRLRQEAGTDLSPSLTSALATIDRHGPLTPSELAAREHVQRPTATRMLGRLEADGLVGRTPDPQDRRSSLLAITPEGHALMEAMRNRKTAFLVPRLESLSAEERDTLAAAAEILDRVRDL
jgi:DNA-binding MarR family transcriptional regulator